MSFALLLLGLLGVILDLLVVGGELNNAESHARNCDA